MLSRIFLLSAVLFCFMDFNNTAHAQSFSVLKELDFGEAVVTDNHSRYSITVRSNGSYTANNIFILLRNPTEGLYHIEGLPVSTAITDISIEVDQQMIGFGEDFTIDNFNIKADSSTDSNGVLDVSVGARLRTSGSGQNYMYDAQFESAMTITINY